MNYISRTLTYKDKKDNPKSITDNELLNIKQSVVILAEPGMGKTSLLEHLNNFENTNKFTASSFVRRPLGRLKDIGKSIVLIDALDEYQSQVSSNPIDDILNKLFELGSPQFILSCRQIEWSESSISSIKDYYDKEPIITSIQPFNRTDAITFLNENEKFTGDTEDIIQRLDEVNLSNFYESPLTLELLTHINTKTLPDNKADILNLATQNLWQEVNNQAPNHLKKTGKKTILECAGFICATLLLAQKQVVFTGITAKTLDQALNIYELKSMYSEELLLDTLKCRIFKSSGDSQSFKPMHRTIAEFLGGRWLAEIMTDLVTKKRVLAQVIQNGGVVSSLRGLFSWLPYFNPDLAQTVIETDPYALIAYADTSFFTDRHSRLMYDALQRLVKVNPSFRRENWNSLKAKGLANKSLLEEYRELLSNKDSDYNLRSSVIQILQDANFVEKLSNELITIMLEDDRYYSERFDACLLLLEKQINVDWSTILDNLTDSRNEDNLRLVCECIMKRDNYHLISDEQLIRLIINSQPLKKGVTFDSILTPDIGSYYYFETLPSIRSNNLLELLTIAIEDLNISPYEANYSSSKNINGLVFLFLKKYLIDSNYVDPQVLVRSLTFFYHNQSDLMEHDFQDYSNFFTFYFAENTTLRLAVQKLFLRSNDVHGRFFQIKDSVLSALYPSINETLSLLTYVQKLEDSQHNKNIWKDLLLLNRSRTGFDNKILKCIEGFILHKPDLCKFIEEYDQPRQKSQRELEYERESRNRRLEKKLNQQRNRTQLRENRKDLEAGDFHTCFYPANILLKRYPDLQKDLHSYTTLEHLLKEDLTYSARKGFENSLFNSIPKPLDFVLNEHRAKETVLYAGIYCRYLDNKPLDDLDDNIILVCAIIIAINSYLSSNYDSQIGVFELVKKQIIDRNLKNKLIDTLLLPQFEYKWEYIKGIHWLIKTEVTNTDIDKIVNILEKYTLNKQNQRRLIEAIINHKRLDKLEPLIRRKVSNIEYLNEIDDLEDASLWLALYSYVDEKNFITKAKCFRYMRELYWELSELYQQSGNSKKVACTDFMKEWIIYRYHFTFSNISRPLGTSSGNRNPWQASDFIYGLLVDLSNIPSDKAYQTLKGFQSSIHNSYQTHITNLLFQQQNKIREQNYVPPSLESLLNIYENELPKDCLDLKAFVITLLDEIQAEIYGSETDPHKAFYQSISTNAKNFPHGENDCRDRLVDLLKPKLQVYGFSLETERDMPDDKRADIVCRNTSFQLPIEVKGQWHEKLWTAMNVQLGDLYLKEHQSQGQGIYLIFWFGQNVVANRSLNTTAFNKTGISEKPNSAKELKSFLDDRIEDKYRNSIEIYVMDISRN
ncbi:hypothetical protein [uncultured Psychrobacter sp.]|uniref:NACHT domain-containing protein n=1 Tax=uncultured Psychrobacter sp. TaxID=259303 RepID=UPI0026140F10|nr:hypothetical protein [uncultured Psychrobacter sp.]